MAGEETVIEETQETVDPSSLSDEELSTQLKGDTTEPVKETEEIKPEVSEVEPEAKKEEETPSQEETVSIPKAEYEKMKQRIENEQAFIARQGTEIGELRKRKQAIEAEIAQIKGSLTFDNLAENTGQTLERAAQLESKNRELQNLETSEYVQNNRSVVDHFVPDFANLRAEMLEIAQEDNVPMIADLITNNPYLIAPDTAINLAKRAALRIENKKLKAENEALKGKTETVLNKIEKAAAQKPAISAKTAQPTVATIPISDDQIADLSDADLKELLKQKSKGG